MNTSTLPGIFPDPKPVHRRNFLRENIKHLKEMQGFIQQENISSKSQEIKPDKFKHVTSKVYSNISNLRKSSKDNVGKRPLTHTQMTKNVRGMTRYFPTSKSEIKAVHRGIQTERPEDVSKLYETGTLKYPTSSSKSGSSRTREHGDVGHSVTKNAQKVGDTTQNLSKKIGDAPHNVIKKAGDAPQNLTKKTGDIAQNITKNLQKLDLEGKHNYVKENIKNVKLKTKRDESPDPNLAPPNYQKGTVPKYLKERKEENKSVEFVETDSMPGLVLLPDDERKEYLRVARENYAGLIKELNSMPVSNDTLKRRKRKIEIEDELRRLDEVIKIFQKPKVFVKADA